MLLIDADMILHLTGGACQAAECRTTISHRTSVNTIFFTYFSSHQHLADCRENSSASKKINESDVLLHVIGANFFCDKVVSNRWATTTKTAHWTEITTTKKPTFPFSLTRTSSFSLSPTFSVT